MRKISDFIVNKKYLFLCTFIFLAILSFVASMGLSVNYDVAKYLPDDSEVKVGLSIMQQEFDEDSSTMNVMFSNLPEKENQSVIDYIGSIEDVGGIIYLDTAEYKDTIYTLFQVSVDAAKDSEEAAKVYRTITEKYENYKVKTQGDISDYNRPLLPIWIVIIAVVCALIILVVMCNSYIEPFIFLFTILIGVALNKGTNLIFGEISNITSSIFPILQMALSMDYSIMLADRYDRERAKTSDKNVAMKNALHDSFRAISSSSITTVVGLLALVFMRFKIGEDLGFVLAKGVLFCLISIFTCMPGLLIAFDGAIQKTKKKKLNIKMSWLGAFEYKIRFLAIPLFLIIFASCLFAKSGLGYEYTLTKINSVGDVFDLDNQIAVIYDNDDEEVIADYCQSLKKNDNIKDVLCYGTTLNESLKYNELNDKIASFGMTDSTIEEYLIKLVYYKYYNGDKDLSLKISSLINFIETEIYPKEDLAKHISEKTKKDLSDLSYFVQSKNLNKKYTSAELAEKFGIEQDLIDDLMVYYNSKNISSSLSMAEFVDFIDNYVLSSKYSTNVDNNVISRINTAKKYTDRDSVAKAMSYDEMASFFDISSSEMKEIYLYYILVTNFHTKPSWANFVAILKNPSLLSEKYCINKRKITPKELISFIFEHKDDRIMSGKIDNAMLEELKSLDSLITSVISNKGYSASEISQTFNIDESKIKLLYSLYEIKHDQKDVSLSLRDFVNLLVDDIAKNPEYKSALSGDILNKLKVLQKVINNELSSIGYTVDELGNLLSNLNQDLDKGQISLVYLFYGSVNDYDDNISMTIESFVNYLKNDILSDSQFDDYIDDDTRSMILEAKDTVDNAKKQLVGEKYSRFVLNTEYPVESDETFAFVEQAKKDLSDAGAKEFYIIGNSPMSYEISQTFDDELNFITILTVIFIFAVVLLAFRSISIPIILVSLIQCAVFLTMGIMAFSDGSIYFIALLIVQSILMGATIDYAILYTSYYIEHRRIYNKKESIIKSYEKSLNAILTSGLILTIVTLVVGCFTSDAAARICIALSKGAMCSLFLVIFLLPSLLSALDRFVIHKNKKHV